MGFYVYTLAIDSGFAPNPFYGVCTLACCKPKIRAKAKKGDWVLGITPKALGHKLAYAMRVDEVLTFDQYFRDPRFATKKPGRGPFKRYGDNCYKPLRGGGFRQLPSMHYDRTRCRENVNRKATDLGGKRVLVSRHFAYFGGRARAVRTGLNFMMPARYHRARFSPSQEAAIRTFVERLSLGRHGRPRDGKGPDASQRKRG